MLLLYGFCYVLGEPFLVSLVYTDEAATSTYRQEHQSPSKYYLTMPFQLQWFCNIKYYIRVMVIRQVFQRWRHYTGKLFLGWEVGQVTLYQYIP